MTEVFSTEWSNKEKKKLVLPLGNDNLDQEAVLNKMLLSGEFDKPRK